MRHLQMRRFLYVLIGAMTVLVSFSFVHAEPAAPFDLSLLDSLPEDSLDIWRIQLKNAIAYESGVLKLAGYAATGYLGDQYISLTDYSIEQLELVKAYVDSLLPENEQEMPNPEITTDMLDDLSERECEFLLNNIETAISARQAGIDYDVYFKFSDSNNVNLVNYSYEDLEKIESYLEGHASESGAEELPENDVNRPDIFFRDIEWGLPYSEVEDQIPADHWFLFDSDYASPVKDDVIDSYRNICYDDYVRGYTHSSTDLEVGGYPVDLIRIWFAYTTDDAEILHQDKDHTAFYEAEYVLKAKDVSGVYEDLTNKLISLYGEIAEQGSIQHYNYTSDKYALWFGANESIVALKTDLRQNKVRISYGWLKGDEFLRAAYDALAEEEKSKAGNGDTGGL